ncbi:MAG: radical SAM protein [Deltaproteobacteria bacterium]|nr:radical SAM protein [Deltaproteobacteria bacterium]
MQRKVLVNIHAVIPLSTVNGPGRRLVVFFQGCENDCPGCFNPETHPLTPATLSTPEELFQKYLRKGTDGVTVSGGEPFLQPDGLYRLLKTAKKTHGLTTVVYTGFDYEELAADNALSRIFDFTDVLIDGRFDRTRMETTLLARGSTNQRLHFLGGPYTMNDFYMPGKVEVIIGPDGRVIETGFSSITLLPQ